VKKAEKTVGTSQDNQQEITRAFNYTLDFDNTDFRAHPELYRVGRGEQGVLLVEPYKSEILPYWRFKTEEVARVSAEKIYALFENYLQKEDFVGADMARKFLQMGFTRARRYANYKGGKKYKTTEGDTNDHKSYPYSSGSPHKGNALNDLQDDALTNEKARAAAVFKDYWFKAKAHGAYVAQKDRFLSKL
jgi:hypothetical protein